MLVVITSGKYHYIEKKRHLKISTSMGINQTEIQKDYQNAFFKKDCVKFWLLVYISIFQTILMAAAGVVKGEVSLQGCSVKVSVYWSKKLVKVLKTKKPCKWPKIFASYLFTRVSFLYWEQNVHA